MTMHLEVGLFGVKLTGNAHTVDVPAAMTLKPWVLPVKAD
jgi:hypothetical protein